MAALGQRRVRKGDLDVAIDMVPVMNMFLVLIPFLLMSSSFLHLKAINTSVPVRAETVENNQLDKKDRQEIKIRAIVRISDSEITLTASSYELQESELKRLDSSIKRKGKNEQQSLIELSLALQVIKLKYPKSDTLILMPADNIIYETITKAMDAARYIGEAKLFPNVVISGEVS